MTKQQQEELLSVAQEIVSDFDNYGEVLQTGFDGGYGKDTAIYRLRAIVKQIKEVKMTVIPKRIIDSLFDVANEMKELSDDTYDEEVSAILDQ